MLQPSTVMTPEEFRLLQEFVSDNFGIVLDDTKRSFLNTRLLPRLQHLRLRSFFEYYTYLKFGPHTHQEQQLLIPLVTNNETYFYREEPQLNVFAREVLPQLREEKMRRSSRKLRIVSAGCSTGEEPYTLAMLAMESGLFLWDWEVEIIGVDLDPEALSKAAEGVYASKSFQTIPPQYLARYFTKTVSGHAVRQNLRSMVSFRQGNLLQLPDVLRGETADVIFCRNVFIYFPEDLVRRAVTGFARLLARDGLLFLGHSESLSRITALYEPVRRTGAIYYRLRHEPL